uniref:Uncharacterized protein n=1 Tax=Escherichia coli TaxID=562 RepID=A0A3G4RWV6_ECOLX|nr:hypothetical protein D0378_00226 [Escherichia coli]
MKTGLLHPVILSPVTPVSLVVSSPPVSNNVELSDWANTLTCPVLDETFPALSVTLTV